MRLFRTVLHHVGDVTRRRLLLAVVATCLLAPIEIAGVALVVPLMEVFSEGEISGGAAGSISEWTGVTDPDDLALVLGVAIVLLFATRALATLVVRWWTLGTLFDAERDAATRMLRGYLDEPYEKHLDRNSAEILRTLQLSVDQTFGGYVAATLNVFAEVLVGASILGLLLVIQPVPTLILAGYFAVVGPVYLRFVQRRAYGIGNRMQDLSRDSILVARDALDGVKELTVLQRESEFLRRFHVVRTETGHARQWMQFLREAPRFMIEILFLVGITVLLAALTLGGASEELVPTLGVFVAAGFRLMPPLGRLISAQSAMRSSAAAVENVAGELERFESDTAARQSVVEQDVGFVDELVFHGVTFQHAQASRPSVRELTVSIKPGESVAIVGPSGAGKTTLVDLVLGLHRPTEGRVLIDGVPLEHCVRSWRALIGYVPQDVYLVDASLRENIALGVQVDSIDEEAVVRAIERAQLGDFVRSLDHGVDTKVGERGTRLSGGQRQRIGIARALYGKPRLLILDEATSALDSETEARIGETIADLRTQMTVIAIAHRLTTLRDFERVLFLDDGALVGDGSFCELRDEHPDFARLLAQSNLDLTQR